MGAKPSSYIEYEKQILVGGEFTHRVIFYHPWVRDKTGVGQLPNVPAGYSAKQHLDPKEGGRNVSAEETALMAPQTQGMIACQVRLYALGAPEGQALLWTRLEAASFAELATDLANLLPQYEREAALHSLGLTLCKGAQVAYAEHSGWHTVVQEARRAQGPEKEQELEEEQVPEKERGSGASGEDRLPFSPSISRHQDLSFLRRATLET